jgi:uncharacterized membrane protein YozB (DUF420 family)
MLKNVLKKHATFVSIFLFIVLYIYIQVIKPSYVYNKNGTLRTFGVGYKNKTIIPLWLVSIILGILCYVFVLYNSTNFH